MNEPKTEHVIELCPIPGCLKPKGHPRVICGKEDQYKCTLDLGHGGPCRNRVGWAE